MHIWLSNIHSPPSLIVTRTPTHPLAAADAIMSQPSDIDSNTVLFVHYNTINLSLPHLFVPLK